MTKTESLLREAKSICQEVTEREEVSDELLRAVFMRLDDEIHEVECESDDDRITAGCTIH